MLAAPNQNRETMAGLRAMPTSDNEEEEEEYDEDPLPDFGKVVRVTE